MTAGPEDRLNWHEGDVEVVPTAPSGRNLMQEWLNRDLFDSIPEGLPVLEAEDDDEGEDDA
jgi:hypothetical protein